MPTFAKTLMNHFQIALVSLLWHYLTSEKFSKVVLSGDGDELFGGYDYYKIM